MGTGVRDLLEKWKRGSPCLSLRGIFIESTFAPIL
jgi:hypothetical protein